MADGVCVLCRGVKAPGRVLCRRCERVMGDNLRVLRAAAGPLLDVALKRANPSPASTGPRGNRATAPDPIRVKPWALYGDVQSWASRALRAIGMGKMAVLPPADAYGVLIDHAGDLAGLADAPSWWEDLDVLVCRVRRILDPDVVPVAYGMCPHCGGVVWGEPDGQLGQCRSCRVRVPRSAVSDRLLARLAVDDVRGSAAEMASRCARAGVRVPASTIRSWVRRGRVRVDDDGRIALSALLPLIRARASR